MINGIGFQLLKSEAKLGTRLGKLTTMYNQSLFERGTFQQSLPVWLQIQSLFSRCTSYWERQQGPWQALSHGAEKLVTHMALQLFLQMGCVEARDPGHIRYLKWGFVHLRNTGNIKRHLLQLEIKLSHELSSIWSGTSFLVFILFCFSGDCLYVSNLSIINHSTVSFVKNSKWKRQFQFSLSNANTVVFLNPWSWHNLQYSQHADNFQKAPLE